MAAGVIEGLNMLDFMDIMYYNVYISDLGNIAVYDELELIPRELYHSKVWKSMKSLRDTI